jgi:hypothetical protein
MTNAKQRRQLERMSAPVLAVLIEQGYVVDDGGILNLTWQGQSHIREAVLVASRTLNGARETRLGSSVVEQQNHNLRRVGSSPIPATTRSREQL